MISQLLELFFVLSVFSHEVWQSVFVGMNNIPNTQVTFYDDLLATCSLVGGNLYLNKTNHNVSLLMNAI